MADLAPIEVRHYGATGPTAVVLHGGPGAPGSAAGLARLLSTDLRVLEPLQRRSGMVRLVVSRHVEDLAMIAPNPAVLVGASWGAMLGLSFAARYPKAVSALVLVGCGTYDEASRATYQRSLDQRLGDAGRRKLKRLEARLAAEADPSRRDLVMNRLGALHMQAASFDPIDEVDRSRDVPSIDYRGHLETWQDVLRLQREGIEPAAFAAITAPVLMVHGNVDPHPGPATRDVLRRFIPTLEYVELDRCGHEPWRERQVREHFAKLVVEWIVRRSRDGP